MDQNLPVTKVSEKGCHFYHIRERMCKNHTPNKNKKTAFDLLSHYLIIIIVTLLTGQMVPKQFH